MSLQEFAALVAKHAKAVRAEYRSLEAGVQLAAKHGAGAAAEPPRAARRQTSPGRRICRPVSRAGGRRYILDPRP